MEKTQIHITGSQAIRLVRMAREGSEITAVPCDERLTPIDTKIRHASDLCMDKLLQRLRIRRHGPLELLVPNTASRRWANDLHTAVITPELPKNSFLELRPGRDAKKRIVLPDATQVFVASPELQIIQMAQQLQEMVRHGKVSRYRAQLKILGFADECCGRYFRDADNPKSGNLHYDNWDTCTRFATPESIDLYIKSVRHIDGLGLTRSILRYIIDESGSLMETYLNHALTLPPRMAGFSMRKPLANKQLQADEKLLGQMKHQSIRPDLQWPEYRMLAEYLGDKEHAGKPARIEDKNRMQDYAIAQYVAFPLMFDDIKNAGALGRTATMLAEEFTRHGLKKEKYRVASLLRNDEFLSLQRILIATMLPPITRYDN